MKNVINQSENRKKITWVTPDYFVDTDFNPELLSGILTHFDIVWIVLLPATNARYAEKDFEKIKELQGLKIEFFYWNCRARSLRMLSFYQKVYERIKELNADLVYFNYVPTSPYVLPLYWRLNKRRTIVTAHDGNVKASFKMAWISRAVFSLAFRTVKYVNMFSKSEVERFKMNFKSANVFIIPLGLKDFGKSNVEKRGEDVAFLFLGSIHSNKNLELLIDAACNLYEEGYRGFKIVIIGSSKNWEFYKTRIRYPELFECDIRIFQNDEIPNIFARSDYMILPYSEMSQSGALKVAFNYHVPVIVSDLEGFTEEVKPGINGFVFKSNDVKDLERVLSERLRQHKLDYPQLREAVAKYNRVHYSPEVLQKKYLDMFSKVLAAS